MSHRGSGNRGSRRWPAQRGGTPKRYGAGPGSYVRREIAERPGGSGVSPSRQTTGRPGGSNVGEPTGSAWKLVQFRANQGVSVGEVWGLVARFVPPDQHVYQRAQLARGLPIDLRESEELDRIRPLLERVGRLTSANS